MIMIAVYSNNNLDSMHRKKKKRKTVKKSVVQTGLGISAKREAF